MSRFLPDIAGLFALIVFLVFSLLISDQFLADGDPFWHIKAGSVMLEQGRLLTQDIFSHTAYGTPWTAHEWLAEIIMAGLHRLAGLEGVILFFILLTAMTFWLLFKVAERLSDEKTALAMVLVALFFSGVHLTARPHLFTWFFLVLTLALLTHGGYRLYWLPIIIALWANIHGGVVLGLLLQGVFIFGATLEAISQEQTPLRLLIRQVKNPLIVLMISLVAIGLNPFGYSILLFPFQVTSDVFSAHISEWQPPNFQELWYFRITLLLLVFALTLRRFRLNWTERLLLLFFLDAALIHSRNISLLFLIMAPFLARALHQILSERFISSRPSESQENLKLSPLSGPMLVLGLTMLLLLVGTINHATLGFLTPQKAFGVEIKALNRLSAHLKDHQPAGNMFNDYVLGGFLLYALDPPPKVFIDGRADMYGEEIFADYGKIVRSEQKRRQLLDTYGIDWVVFREDTGLVFDLLQSGHWEKRFKEKPYVMLVKSAGHSGHQEHSEARIQASRGERD